MYEIKIGNVLEKLKEIDDEVVDTVVTSPPYYGLRDYGTGKWTGGNEDCEHEGSNVLGNNRNFVDREGRGSNNPAISNGTCVKCGAVKEDKQIGLEETPEEFINRLVEVFREVRRVLKPSGTLWVNIGDSYWGGKGASGQSDSEYQENRASKGESLNKGHHQIGGSKKTRPTDKKHSVIKPKDLVGIPWMLAFALRADGWYLRQDIIWSKSNPMPESVKDRCTKSHEYIFLLSKSKHYYYDHEAIKEPAHTTDTSNRDRDNTKLNNTPGRTKMGGLKTNHYTTKNKRSVWDLEDSKYGSIENEAKHRQGMHRERGENLVAHRPLLPKQKEFVDFIRQTPKSKLIEKSNIKASTIEHWYRYDDSGFSYPSVEDWNTISPLLEGNDVAEIDRLMTYIEWEYDDIKTSDTKNKRSVWDVSCKPFKGAHFAVFPPELIEPCILAGSPKNGVVLDPFAGSGTTGGVAEKHGRNSILIELNPEFASLIPQRIIDIQTTNDKSKVKPIKRTAEPKSYW